MAGLSGTDYEATFNNPTFINYQPYKTEAGTRPTLSYKELPASQIEVQNPEVATIDRLSLQAALGL